MGLWRLHRAHLVAAHVQAAISRFQLPRLFGREQFAMDRDTKQSEQPRRAGRIRRPATLSAWRFWTNGRFWLSQGGTITAAIGRGNAVHRPGDVPSQRKFDVALVDGRFRVACAYSAALRLAPNGTILLHDFGPPMLPARRSEYEPAERGPLLAQESRGLVGGAKAESQVRR